MGSRSPHKKEKDANMFKKSLLVLTAVLVSAFSVQAEVEINGKAKRVQVGDYPTRSGYHILMDNNVLYPLGNIDDAAAKARYAIAVSAITSGLNVVIIYTAPEHLASQIIYMGISP
jgi:hypothetical protein